MAYPDYSFRAASSSHSRWFDGGPRRLRILLMASWTLIAGMFLGRFVTQSAMDRTVTVLQAEQNNRDAEIRMLRHQAMQPPPQQRELDMLGERHRQLQMEYAELEKGLAKRQELMERAMGVLHREEEVCLGELRRFQQAKQSLPAGDVIRFAEQVFAAKRELLHALNDGREMTSVAMQPVPFPAFQEPSAASDVTDRLANTDAPSGPELPPAPLQTSSSADGVYFDAPPRRTGYTFIGPRASSRVVAGSPRFLFSDDAGKSDGPILR